MRIIFDSDWYASRITVETSLFLVNGRHIPVLSPCVVQIGPHDDAGVVDTVRARAHRPREIEITVGTVDPCKAMTERDRAFLVIEDPDELPARVNIAAGRPWGARKVERAVLAVMENVPMKGAAIESTVGGPISDNVAIIGYLPRIRCVRIRKINACEAISGEQESMLVRQALPSSLRRIFLAEVSAYNLALLVDSMTLS